MKMRILQAWLKKKDLKQITNQGKEHRIDHRNDDSDRTAIEE